MPLDDREREELQSMMDKNTKQLLLAAVNLCKVTKGGFGKTRDLLTLRGTAVATQLWFIPNLIVVENCSFSEGTKLAWHKHPTKQFTIVYEGKAVFYEKEDMNNNPNAFELVNEESCCAMGKCVRYTEPMVEHSIFCPVKSNAIIIYMPALPDMEVK